MEMNPQDDDKPATLGVVRTLGIEMREEMAALREEMVTKSMFQSAMISLTKSISDLGDTLSKRIEKLEQHVTGTLQDFAGKQHEQRIGELEAWRRTK